MPAVLLSIKPQYAQAILDGRKRFELRRRVPACARGMLVVLYASSPTREVVGVCRVEGVLTLAPRVLWAHVGRAACVSRAQFDAYFAGCGAAFAIKVGSPRMLRRAIPLAAVQEALPGFRPPQSWCWLRRERVRDVVLAELVEQRLSRRRAG